MQNSTATQDAMLIDREDVIANDAVKLFTGQIEQASGNKDHRLFETWYDQFVIQYLTHLLPPQIDIYRYVFSISDRNAQSYYYQQFTSLSYLSRELEKCVCFIAYESPVNQNHYIFCVIINEAMLVINPSGLTRHQDFAAYIATIQQQAAIKKVYFATNIIQRDPDGVVSCGPLCVELMRHISTKSFKELLELFNSWNLQTSNEVNVAGLLPDSLISLEKQTDKNYIDALLTIRTEHLNILSNPSTANVSIEKQNEVLAAAIQAKEQSLVTDIIPSLSNLELEAADIRIVQSLRQVYKQDTYKMLGYKKDYLQAIKDDEQHKVMALLDKEPAVLNCLSLQGDTALTLAIKHNREGVIRPLLDRGIARDAGYSVCTSAANYAKSIGKDNLAKIIRDYELQEASQSHSVPAKMAKPSNINSSVKNIDIPGKSQLSYNVKNIYKVNTKGDGNCFFHAVFGEVINESCQAKNADNMRKEWHKFLAQFTSLGDGRMPAALKEQLKTIFNMFIDQPALLTGKAEEIEKVVKQAKVRLDGITTQVVLLKQEICKKYQENEEIRAVIYKKLQEVFPKKKLASMNELSTMSEVLSSLLHDELAAFAFIINPTLSQQEYDKQYRQEYVLTQCLEQTELYQAYLSAIQRRDYYIFFEEIPILASLASVEIELHYTDRGPQTKIFSPNSDMLNVDYKINSSLWSQAGQKIIEHEGIHYSQLIMRRSEVQLEHVIKNAQSKTAGHTISNESSLPTIDPRFLLARDKYAGSRGLKKSLHGNLYQLGLLVLIAQRAKQAGKEFALVTEADVFEKFDDLVVEDANSITFLQAKHAAKSGECYNLKDLCAAPDSSENEASLAKYFDSWCILKQRYPTKSLKFIFFTNRGFTKEVKGYLEDASQAEDNFLFTGFNSTTQKIKEQADLRTKFITAIEYFSQEIPKSLTTLELADGKHNEDINKLVDLLLKNQAKAIKIAHNKNITKEQKLLLISILDLDNLDLDKITPEKAQATQASSSTKNNELLSFKLKLSFIRNNNLKGIAAQIRHALDPKLGENQDEILKKLQQTKILCPKNLFELETKTQERKAKQTETEQTETKQKKAKVKCKTKFEINPTGITWHFESKFDQLLLLSLFEETHLSLASKPKSAVQKYFFRKLIKIFYKDFTSFKTNDEKKFQAIAKQLKIEDEINQFLSELIFKTAQPNRFDLDAIIQRELAINTNLASKELYQQLYQYVLNWLAKSECQVLEDKGFNAFITLSQIDLERFYLLGQTSMFMKEFAAKPLQSRLKVVVKSDEICNFLDNNNQDKNILIIKGERQTGKRLSVYNAITQLEDLQEDAWAYLDIKSPNFCSLSRLLTGKTLKFVVIDEVAGLTNEQQNILAEICQTAVSHQKKLILLVDTEQEEKLIKLREMFAKLASDTKILTLNIQRLAPEELRSICSSYLTKQITIGERNYTIEQVLANENSSLFQVMLYPEWLQEILNSETSESINFSLNLPLGVYVPNTIFAYTPCYSLATILEQTHAKLFIVRNPISDTVKRIQTLLGAERIMFSLEKNSDKEKVRYRIVDASSLALQSMQLMDYPEKIIICGNYKVEDSNHIVLQLMTERMDNLIVTLAESYSHALPQPIDYLEPKHEHISVIEHNTFLYRSTEPKIHLISADAGKGKSALFRYLQYQWQNSVDSSYYSWLFRLSLPELGLSNNEPVSFETILFSSLMTKQAQPAWVIAALKIDIEQGSVKLLLDAWDEVKGEQQRLVNQFIANIPATISYDVSTRPYAKSSLSLPRAPDSYLSLKTFNNKQIKKYIQSYFNAALTFQMSENIVPTITQHVVIWLEKGIGQNIAEFIGIPLQTYLLCEGLSPHIQSWLAQEQIDNIIASYFQQNKALTGVKLYQYFTFAKLNLFLKNQLKIDNPQTLTKPHRVYTFTQPYINLLMIKAYQQLFAKPLKFVSEFQRNIYYTTEIIEELLETGLVTSYHKLQQDITYHFIHETYQEYFAALFILNTLLAGTDSHLYQIILWDIWEKRYLEKYKVIFAFAAQLSLEGDPLLPGWEANKKWQLPKFWQALLQEPEDLLGRAKNQLFVNCIRGLTTEHKKELMNLLGEGYTSLLQNLANSGSQPPDSDVEDSQEQQDGTTPFSFQIGLSLEQVDEDETFINTDSSLIAELSNKNEVFNFTQKFITANPRNVLKLAELFEKIIEEDKVSSYWDIDGGFMSMALLANQFNKVHADYFIERIQGDPSWRAKPAAAAMLALAANPLEGKALEAFLLVTLALYAQERHHKFSLFIEQLLQSLSSEVLIIELIQIFQNELQGSSLTYTDKMSFLLDKAHAELNTKLLNLLKLICFIAYQAKYAVVFIENDCQLLLFTHNTCQKLSVSLEQQANFKLAIEQLFANYQQHEAYFSKTTGNDVQLALIMPVQVLPYLEKRLLKFGNDLSGYEISEIYRKLDENQFMTKSFANILQGLMNTHTDRRDEWNRVGGIKAIGYMGKYFNEEFADFLALHATCWDDNEEVSIKALGIIRKNLANLIKNKLIDDDVCVAIAAYNSCINNISCCNLTALPLPAAEAAKSSDFFGGATALLAATAKISGKNLKRKRHDSNSTGGDASGVEENLLAEKGIKRPRLSLLNEQSFSSRENRYSYFQSNKDECLKSEIIQEVPIKRSNPDIS